MRSLSFFVVPLSSSQLLGADLPPGEPGLHDSHDTSFRPLSGLLRGYVVDWVHWAAGQESRAQKHENRRENLQDPRGFIPSQSFQLHSHFPSSPMPRIWPSPPSRLSLLCSIFSWWAAFLTYHSRMPRRPLPFSDTS